MSMTVERTFVLDTGDHGKKIATDQPATPRPAPATAGRVPRITRLMALAIKFEGYVRDGFVKDYAELARLGHVTRARLTQIMDLNLLAPDIQEAILDLPRTVEGRDGVTMKDVMGVLDARNWQQQRHIGSTSTPTKCLQQHIARSLSSLATPDLIDTNGD